MKKYYLFFCIIFSFCCEDIGKGYNWRGDLPLGFSRRFGTLGYDYGWNAAYSPFDGGTVVVGRRSPEINGQNDMWAIKTDARGLLEWEHSFGGSGNEDGYDVIATSDGGFLFVGHTWSFGNKQQVYAVKTDFHGNTLWEKTYGGDMWDVGEAVIEVKGGGFVIAGYSNSPGISSGNTDIYLIKIDIDGTLLWQRGYGNAAFPNHERAYDIFQMPNEGFMVVGSRDRYATESRNILIINVDLKGNLVWEKEIKSNGYIDEVAYSISPTNQGDLFICTMINSITDPGIFQPQVIKIDSHGNIDWQRTFRSNSRKHHRFSAASTQSGDLVIIGSSNQSMVNGSKDDAFIVRIDSNGNILWTRPYGTADHDDWGWSIFETPNTNLVFVGSTQSFGASLFDVYLVGTNSEGLTQ